ncbi:MAG: NUDIX hydrolase [Pyrinomonadaceae bacterium]
MIKKLISIIWSGTPRPVRIRLIRLTQNKFTASVAAVIINKAGEVVLLDHVLRPYSNWGLPGGFIEHGENPEEAIRRELLEEIGLELENLRFFRIRTIGRHIEILFAAETSGTGRVLSREINRLGWFTKATLPAEVSRTQRKIIEEILDGRTGDATDLKEN